MTDLHDVESGNSFDFEFYSPLFFHLSPGSGYIFLFSKPFLICGVVNQGERREIVSPKDSLKSGTSPPFFIAVYESEYVTMCQVCDVETWEAQ